MEKKILFVLNTLTVGGVTSSLSCVYEELKTKYSICILPLDYDVGYEINFSNALLPRNRELDAYHCNYALAEKKDRLYIRFIKYIKRISIIINWDYEGFISKKTIKKIEKQYDFDVIIAFQDGASTQFCQYFKNPNKIAWIHCDYTQLFAGRYEEALYKKYIKIVCVSKYTAKRFVERYPSLSDRTTYIYNILDIDRIKFLSKALVNDDKFLVNKFTIISMGRIVPLKRFSSIPFIARAVKDSGAVFNWYILGPDFDKQELEAINKRIEELNVSDCVRWLGNKPNPYPYLKAADLYVSLSTTEACPMVFNESRILDVPIMSTNFGSSFEFIEDEKNGIIRPIEKISDVITKLIKDKDYYNYFKINTSKFNIDNGQIVKSITELLDNDVNLNDTI